MSTKLYLDVSVVRIQSYLSRTTKLKGRRGASAALAEATRLPEDAPLLADGRARINEEAGEADGVINLVLDHPGDPDAVEAEARALAERVFADLREMLPGAEFRAVWGEGTGYLEAYDRWIGPRLAGGEVLSDLPPVRELTYAVTCQTCHLDPAVGTIPARVAHDEARSACADCLMRYSRESHTRGRTAEEVLLGAVEAKSPTEEFPELAALGAPDSGRNHLAHVFIDGNAFGDFFHHLARHGGHLDPEVKTAVSRDLNKATRTALAEATRAGRRDTDAGKLCVVPHVVGGDDVLVTLPADRGWRFVRRYLECFGELTEKTRHPLTRVPELPRLSASAGITFAHHKIPFNLAVEAAEQRLRAAKSLVRGRQASVGFVDITRDGSLDRAADPIRLADLEAAAKDLTTLARRPAAFRNTLAGLWREGDADGLRAVRTTARRLNQEDAVAPFLPAATGAVPPASAPAIPLALALRIVRWWR
ncbi:Cas10/Cmr2 second palm domain-containing protein [Streptomyces alkaliphilus]|uniref:Cas10/Cmr2 second palm domain-containing protein n=1 Tax=Streptomyces alkaliphilus TaxID=1472722 RepID=UPI00117DD0BC|nr:hypothetical protein [Streptomyces alkaliphilus]MQS06741.1 hypothetical protein [Streptomyces alkaliphilus]